MLVDEVAARRVAEQQTNAGRDAAIVTAGRPTPTRRGGPTTTPATRSPSPVGTVDRAGRLAVRLRGAAPAEGALGGRAGGHRPRRVGRCPRPDGGERPLPARARRARIRRSGRRRPDRRSSATEPEIEIGHRAPTASDARHRRDRPERSSVPPGVVVQSLTSGCDRIGPRPPPAGRADGEPTRDVEGSRRARRSRSAMHRSYWSTSSWPASKCSDQTSSARGNRTPAAWRRRWRFRRRGAPHADEMGEARPEPLDRVPEQEEEAGIRGSPGSSSGGTQGKVR